MINNRRLASLTGPMLGMVLASAASVEGGVTIIRNPDPQPEPKKPEPEPAGYVPPSIPPQLQAQLGRISPELADRMLERAERDAIAKYSAADIDRIWQAEEKRRRRAGRG